MSDDTYVTLVHGNGGGVMTAAVDGLFLRPTAHRPLPPNTDAAGPALPRARSDSRPQWGWGVAAA